MFEADSIFHIKVLYYSLEIKWGVRDNIILTQGSYGYMEIQNPQEKCRDNEFTSLMGREII